MSEIIQQLGQKIAEQGVTQEQTAEAQAPPDEEAVAQFEKAMEGEQTSTSQIGDAGASQVKNLASTPETQTLGDQILQGIKNCGKNMKRKRKELINY